MPHGRWHALEPSHRAQADVQVQQLPECHVERPDSSADRRRQWSFDADQVSAERIQRLVREPVLHVHERFLACQHLLPLDPACSAIRLFHRRVEDSHAGAPDVGTRAVSFDEGDGRVIGNLQPAVGDADSCVLGHTDVAASRWNRKSKLRSYTGTRIAGQRCRARLRSQNLSGDKTDALGACHEAKQERVAQAEAFDAPTLIWSTSKANRPTQYGPCRTRSWRVSGDAGSQAHTGSSREAVEPRYQHLQESVAGARRDGISVGSC